MTNQFLTIGLVNAALAASLAALVGIGLRWRYNAHLAAVLWVLVLVKLISPPLAPFSIERSSDVPSPASTAVEDAAGIDRELSVAELANAELRQQQSVPGANENSRDAAAATATAPVAAISAESATATSSPGAETQPKAGSSSHIHWPGVLIAVWLGGSVLALSWLIVSAVRFRRLIRNPELASSDQALDEALARLCERWNIRRVPRLRVIDARVSPLLWTWFDGTTLVVPRGLLASLSAVQHEMLLAHELAHLIRRDHWCRWLEAAVQSLYWWLPVVPWVRQRLHAAQEECCDAFVQREFPAASVDYCDALLTASTWLQGVRPTPVFASELGTVTGLKGRIQTMLEQKMTRPMSRMTVCGCVAVGLMVCGVSIRWVQADPAKPEASATTRQTDAVETEFLITDDQGAPIRSGKLHLRGHYDNNDFFELDRPIEVGRTTFVFKRPRLRKMWLEVSARGFLSHSREYEVEGTDRGFPIESRYSYQLKPGVDIGGRIVDESRDPLENVHVFLSMPSVEREDGGRDSIESWFQTDADGKWSCPGVFPDMSPLKIRLEHATHVDESSEESWPGMRSVQPDEFDALRARTHVRVMHEDPPLVGTVVGSDGKPVAGVTVDVTGRDLDWYQHYARGVVIKTNEAGEFRLPRPPHGEQQLTVERPGSSIQRFDVTVPLSEPLTVTLAEPKGRRMEFRMVDTEGKPIPDIDIAPHMPHARVRGNTDADGRWVWADAPDGVVHYGISSNEYLCYPQDTDYGPGDSPVTVTLRRKLPVIGKVVDAETGEAIPEFRIYKGTHFRSNPPGMWDWWMETTQSMRPVKGSWAEGKVDGKPGTTMQSGRFGQRLHALDRLIRYRVQADGYLPAVSVVLDAAVLPDEPVQLEFRLKKYSGIVGQVRTPDGEVAAGAQIVTLVRRGNDGNGYLSVHNGVVNERSMKSATVVVKSGDEGRFELPVHNDPFVCLITHETGYLEIADRELGTAPELTLLPWKTVTGEVNVQGLPATSVDLHLHSSFDPLSLESGAEVPGVLFSLRATTDANGEYRAAHGNPGKWDVRVSYPAPVGYETPDVSGWPRPSPWRSSSLQVEIEREGATRLDVGREGVDIVGRVIVPEGVAPDWLYSGVHFRRDRQGDPQGRWWRELHQARMSDDGTFWCHNVPVGDYEGQAILGEADDRVWDIGNTSRKRGYEATIRLTADMFEGKSTTDPIDVGTIVLEEVREAE